jgi:hypothetical protein
MIEMLFSPWLVTYTVYAQAGETSKMETARNVRRRVSCFIACALQR